MSAKLVQVITGIVPRAHVQRIEHAGAGGVVIDIVVLTPGAVATLPGVKVALRVIEVGLMIIEHASGVGAGLRVHAVLRRYCHVHTVLHRPVVHGLLVIGTPRDPGQDRVIARAHLGLVLAYEACCSPRRSFRQGESALPRPAHADHLHVVRLRAVRDRQRIGLGGIHRRRHRPDQVPVVTRVVRLFTPARIPGLNQGRIALLGRSDVDMGVEIDRDRIRVTFLFIHRQNRRKGHRRPLTIRSAGAEVRILEGRFIGIVGQLDIAVEGTAAHLAEVI